MWCWNPKIDSLDEYVNVDAVLYYDPALHAIVVASGRSCAKGLCGGASLFKYGATNGSFYANYFFANLERQADRFAPLALLVVGMMQLRKSLRREEGYENLIANALRYRSMNVYDKSMSFYRKAAQLREPGADVQTQMAPVLIVLDRQTAQGRRILERAERQRASLMHDRPALSAHDVPAIVWQALRWERRAA